MKRYLPALIAACIGSAPGLVQADGQYDPMAAPTSAPTATDDGTQLTLPASRWLVNGLVEINLSDDNVFEPVSIAPDLWYGLNDDLTLGIVHSSYGINGLFGGVGSGLCLTGDGDGNCDPDVYTNLNIAARYSVQKGALPIAVTGSIGILDFDPFQLAVNIGAMARWASGSISAVVQPNFKFGLTERDAGNKEVLTLPVGVHYDVSKQLALGAQVALALPFDNTGDTWRIPVSVVGNYLVGQQWYVFGAFTLQSVVGGDLTPDAFDGRVLSLGVGYAN